jgi:transcriptional regulator with XRE-family HTH domain
MNNRQGSYIKQARIDKGFSCQRLANCVGSSRMSVIRAEQRGVRSPKMLFKIAEVLQLDPYTLFKLGND